MPDPFFDRCCKLLTDLGIAEARDVKAVRPLTGGVASDIGMVDLPDRRLCIKFALEKLKVAEDWHAPVHRNRAEYHWLKFAGDLLRNPPLAFLADQRQRTVLLWNSFRGKILTYGRPLF